MAQGRQYATKQTIYAGLSAICEELSSRTLISNEHFNQLNTFIIPTLLKSESQPDDDDLYEDILNLFDADYFSPIAIKDIDAISKAILETLPDDFDFDALAKPYFDYLRVLLGKQNPIKQQKRKQNVNLDEPSQHLLNESTNAEDLRGPLTHDAWVQVFSHLPLIQRIKMGRVNKLFNSFVNQPLTKQRIANLDEPPQHLLNESTNAEDLRGSFVHDEWEQIFSHLPFRQRMKMRTVNKLFKAYVDELPITEQAISTPALTVMVNMPRLDEPQPPAPTYRKLLTTLAFDNKAAVEKKAIIAERKLNIISTRNKLDNARGHIGIGPYFTIGSGTILSLIAVVAAISVAVAQTSISHIGFTAALILFPAFPMISLIIAAASTLIIAAGLIYAAIQYGKLVDEAIKAKDDLRAAENLFKQVDDAKTQTLCALVVTSIVVQQNQFMNEATKSNTVPNEKKSTGFFDHSSSSSQSYFNHHSSPAVEEVECMDDPASTMQAPTARR